jgi:hypothetical protein
LLDFMSREKFGEDLVAIKDKLVALQRGTDDGI